MPIASVSVRVRFGAVLHLVVGARAVGVWQWGGRAWRVPVGVA